MEPVEPVEERETRAEELVDELLPEELEWRPLVERYPLAAITLAALGGFFLGRSRGVEIVGALSSHAADQVSRNVNRLLGEEIL